MTEHARTGHYHHGNLRQALLDAALHILNAHGLQHLSLRAVAREAGVSHAAPYHHFADKSALMRSLVEEYFDHLAAAMQAAARNTPGDELDQLAAMGQAYVQFALQHRAIFRLMFRPELFQPASNRGRSGAIVFRLIDNPTGHADDTAPPAPEDAATSPATSLPGVAAYDISRSLIVAGQAAGCIPPGNPEPFALTAWSTVHGLALLLLDGTNDQLSAEDVARFEQLSAVVTHTLVSGLRVRPSAETS